LLFMVEIMVSRLQKWFLRHFDRADTCMYSFTDHEGNQVFFPKIHPLYI